MIDQSCRSRRHQGAVFTAKLVPDCDPIRVIVGKPDGPILVLPRAAALAAMIAAGSANAVFAADKTIKIVALLPMSGPGSYFGAQDKQGIELALEQLNKSGMNGFKFEVQYEDSACSPLPATQAAKRLL